MLKTRDNMRFATPPPSCKNGYNCATAIKNCPFLRLSARCSWTLRPTDAEVIDSVPRTPCRGPWGLGNKCGRSEMLLKVSRVPRFLPQLQHQHGALTSGYGTNESRTSNLAKLETNRVFAQYPPVYILTITNVEEFHSLNYVANACSVSLISDVWPTSAPVSSTLEYVGA